MPPRAPSARLAAKQRAATTAEATKTSAPSGSRKEQKVAPAKKEVASESNVPRQDDFRKIKGRRGQLKAMTELPYDVLTEIFGHLEPYDLLCLSRASKALRAILVGENTSSLWKKAYENVWLSYLRRCRPTRRERTDIKPPSCPPGESITRFTDFLFGRNCQFCNSTKATNYHWTAWARMCDKCVPKQLETRKYSRLQRISRAIDLCSVSYMAPHSSRDVILRKELERHIRELQSCVDVEARIRYTDCQEAIREARELLADDIENWVDHYNDSFNYAQALVLEKRQADITAKLKEAGYGPEIATRRYRVERLPGASVNAPLTEKGWDKIKADIIRVYEWQRQETRKNAMLRILQIRMRNLTALIAKSQDGIPIYPPASDVARNEPFASFLKGDIEEGPSLGLGLLVGATQSPEEFPRKLASLEQHIPQIAKTWRDDADRSLLSLLPGKKGSAPRVKTGEVDRTPLELATTFFMCHCSCKEPISYPRILMHSCIRSQSIPDRDEDDAPQEASGDEGDLAEDKKERHRKNDTSTQSAGSHAKPDEIYGIPTTTADSVWKKMSSWYRTTWNETDMIEPDEEAYEIARAIVQACKEDPDTVTAAAMNEKDVRVECMRCVARPGRKVIRHVMTWSAAILHDITNHFEETPLETGWKLVTDELELGLIHALESKAPVLKRGQQQPYMRAVDTCIHCADDSPVYNICYIVQPVAPASANTKEVKHHICKAIDAPMKRYPYPVKLTT